MHGCHVVKTHSVKKSKSARGGMATKRGAGRPPSFSVMCGGEAVRAGGHILSQRRPRPALFRQGTRGT
jgi:hypothetical protein